MNEEKSTFAKTYVFLVVTLLLLGLIINFSNNTDYEVERAVLVVEDLKEVSIPSRYGMNILERNGERILVESETKVLDRLEWAGFEIHREDSETWAWHGFEEFRDMYYDGSIDDEGYPFANHYPSVGELNDWYDDLLDEYPDLLTKVNIGESWEGRDLWVLKLTSDDDTQVDYKPGFLVDGAMHAREWSSTQTSAYFMWRLLNEYDSNETIHWMLNNRRIYVMPMVNPDGYIYDGDGSYGDEENWRKNRNDSIPDNEVGVDLNRNWDHHWEDGNSNPRGDDYRGEAPFSEYETKSLRDFILDYDIDTYQNIHSYAGTLLIPWCNSTHPSPHDDWYRGMADHMTSLTSIMGDDSQHYSYGQPGEEIGYSAPGGAGDWVYNNTGAFSLVFELETGGHGFYPPPDEIMTINKDVDDSLIYQGRISDTDLGDGTEHLYPPIPYILYGTVTDSSGNEVVGSEVWVQHQDTYENLYIDTDSNGYYEFNFANLVDDGYEEGDSFTVGTVDQSEDFDLGSEWGRRIDLEVELDEELATFDISLTADGDSDGWNFVSFNLELDDTDLESILEHEDYGISDNYDSVMYYDTSADEWLTYMPGREDHFNNLDTWDHTMGVWIRMNVDDTLTVEGQEPTETTITLYEGWNMVSYAGSEAGTGVPYEVTKIGYFDASEEYNVAYTDDVDGFEFQPGEGYWLYAEQEVDWIVEY